MTAQPQNKHRPAQVKICADYLNEELAVGAKATITKHQKDTKKKKTSTRGFVCVQSQSQFSFCKLKTEEAEQTLSPNPPNYMVPSSSLCPCEVISSAVVK